MLVSIIAKLFLTTFGLQTFFFFVFQKDRVRTKTNYRVSERFKVPYQGMALFLSPTVSRRPHLVSLRPQMDMLSLIPFDLLYVQFGFKSIFRFNRLLKVRQSFYSPHVSKDALNTVDASVSLPPRPIPSLSSAIGWRASWQELTSGGELYRRGSNFLGQKAQGQKHF